MTLRTRLLFVYLIVVMLSVATVGVAFLELGRSRQIIRELQDWNRIVFRLEGFRSSFRVPVPFVLASDLETDLVAGPVPTTVKKAFSEQGIVLSEQARILVKEPTQRWLIQDQGRWCAVARTADGLKASFLPVTPGGQDDLANLIPRQYVELALAPDYLEVDQVRMALNEVQIQYDKWVKLDPEERLRQIGMVREPLDELARAVRIELDNLNLEADRQDVRRMVLMAIVVCLTVLDVVVIGSLLRRWLLLPLEQVNRQVDALAKDEPPTEPLLTRPAEIANLASALDRARISLGDLRRQLIESERLTTIGQFAAQLAHNLRNPLASIRAVAQVVARQNADNVEVTERMGEVVNSVDRLNRWVAGLMEIAQRDSTPTRVADVIPVLHRVREACLPESAAKELDVKIETASVPLVCLHDPETLEHALIAMVVNAIEASPLGETVILRASRLESDSNGEEACRIAVEDHGAGLPADEPDRVFDFSYSTKQHGMGLGLALARLTLQRQGGSAYACNNPDGGATVYVELPAGHGSSREAGETPATGGSK